MLPSKNPTRRGAEPDLLTPGGQRDDDSSIKPKPEYDAYGNPVVRPEEPRSATFAEAAQEALDEVDMGEPGDRIVYASERKCVGLLALLDASIALRDALQGANPKVINMTTPRQAAMEAWLKALAECE